MFSSCHSRCLYWLRLGVLLYERDGTAKGGDTTCFNNGLGTAAATLATGTAQGIDQTVQLLLHVRCGGLVGQSGAQRFIHKRVDDFRAVTIESGAVILVEVEIHGLEKGIPQTLIFHQRVAVFDRQLGDAHLMG